MCQFYCMSEGPSTNLRCLHCSTRYCAACLHGAFEGKMKSLNHCGACGKNPRSKPNAQRESWSGTKVPPGAAKSITTGN